MQFQHVSTCKETQITHMQRNLIKTHINNAPNSGALRQCFFLTNSEVPFLESGKTHRSCRDHEVCTRVSAAGGRGARGEAGRVLASRARSGEVAVRCGAVLCGDKSNATDVLGPVWSV